MNKLTDKELIEELSLRMAEKTNAVQELKLLNLKLEESERLKSHFISNITNEIVNPFSSILGLSKNILSVDKENWKKVLSMVAMIHSEAFSLDFQLKNIFAAAKIEAGEIYPETGSVNIGTLVKSVTDSFRLETLKKKISIETIADPQSESKLESLRTDPEKLKLILSNLVNNAIKFSHEESTIPVRIFMTDSVLNITIQNKGIEISDSYKQFIFDRFKRADSDITSVNRGHGLGLSIIKSLLDLLGGEITFESDALNGTIFKISLPESVEEDNSFTTSLQGDGMFFEENQIF